MSETRKTQDWSSQISEVIREINRPNLAGLSFQKSKYSEEEAQESHDESKEGHKKNSTPAEEIKLLRKELREPNHSKAAKKEILAKIKTLKSKVEKSLTERVITGHDPVDHWEALRKSRKFGFDSSGILLLDEESHEALVRSQNWNNHTLFEIERLEKADSPKCIQCGCPVTPTLYRKNIKDLHCSKCEKSNKDKWSDFEGKAIEGREPKKTVVNTGTEAASKDASEEMASGSNVSRNKGRVKAHYRSQDGKKVFVKEHGVTYTNPGIRVPADIAEEVDAAARNVAQRIRAKSGKPDAGVSKPVEPKALSYAALNFIRANKEFFSQQVAKYSAKSNLHKALDETLNELESVAKSRTRGAKDKQKRKARGGKEWTAPKRTPRPDDKAPRKTTSRGLPIHSVDEVKSAAPHVDWQRGHHPDDGHPTLVARGLKRKAFDVHDQLKSKGIQSLPGGGMIHVRVED